MPRMTKAQRSRAAKKGWARRRRGGRKKASRRRKNSPRRTTRRKAPARRRRSNKRRAPARRRRRTTRRRTNAPRKRRRRTNRRRAPTRRRRRRTNRRRAPTRRRRRRTNKRRRRKGTRRKAASAWITKWFRNPLNAFMQGNGLKYTAAAVLGASLSGLMPSIAAKIPVIGPTLASWGAQPGWMGAATRIGLTWAFSFFVLNGLLGLSPVLLGFFVLGAAIAEITNYAAPKIQAWTQSTLSGFGVSRGALPAPALAGTYNRGYGEVTMPSMDEPISIISTR